MQTKKAEPWSVNCRCGLFVNDTMPQRTLSPTPLRGVTCLLCELPKWLQRRTNLEVQLFLRARNTTDYSCCKVLSMSRTKRIEHRSSEFSAVLEELQKQQNEQHKRRNRRGRSCICRRLSGCFYGTESRDDSVSGIFRRRSHAGLTDRVG